MNDPDLIGNLLRAAVALGIMLVCTGFAARLCRSRTSWLLAGAALLLGFGFLLVGVVPDPQRSGLLYSLQWGIFGAGAYAIGRASWSRGDRLVG